MKDGDNESRRERWARFRFSVIGPLLAAPPGKCELRSELEKLASRDYRHPITGVPTRFGLSTIERWYYQAREAQDPVDELKNRRRKDAGEHPSLGLRLRPLLRTQYREHPSWSYRLHYDNLRAVVEGEPELGEAGVVRSGTAMDEVARSVSAASRACTPHSGSPTGARASRQTRG